MNDNETKPKSFVESLTHDDIAEIGAKWLRSRGYPIAFSNMTSAGHGEQPDVLGFKHYGESFLLEAKVSRSDFQRDKDKPWREEGCGIGKERGYITPKGLLKAEEIPYGWWLLEVHGKAKPIVKIIKGLATERRLREWAIRQGRTGDRYMETVPVLRNIDENELKYFRGDYTEYREELSWLLKIMRRAQDDGIDFQRYANGKHVNSRFKEAK